MKKCKSRVQQTFSKLAEENCNSPPPSGGKFSNKHKKLLNYIAVESVMLLFVTLLI